MNISQIKVLSWSMAALLTVSLSFYVFTFLHKLPEKQKGPDVARVKAVLEAVEPIKAHNDARVDYMDVRRLFLQQCDTCRSGKGTCRHFNWTGKLTPVELPVEVVDVKPVRPKVAVKDLVRVLLVKVDLSDPKNSNTFIRYRPASGVQNNVPTSGFLMHAGDHLSAPHEQIKIASITPDGVTFAYDEPGRENELVSPEEFNLKSPIVEVGPDGAVMKRPETSIPRGTVNLSRPPRTVAIGSNRYMLGTEDMSYVNENYAEELASKVRTARHQDPRTGKYDGIEIKEVAAGSLAERHGAQEGDVIKSINGHPVTSVQEAITYAKNNADKYTVWEIVVENRGKSRTVTYEAPNQ